MKKTWTEFLGWYGVVAILLAYLLNSFTIINTSNAWYSFLNLTGAIGIVVDAWKQKNYQPVVLNIIWAIIALVALFKVMST